MNRLEGKVALVTGSGRNIGRATVLRLASEGADVVVNARINRQEAESVASEARALGVRALACIVDVADMQGVAAMISEAVAEFGKIDILISNAAIRPQKPFTELTLADWERVRGVVLDGAFCCAHAVIPSMVERNFGRIVMATGDGAFSGSSRRAHVSAAKMGLVGLARGLATESTPNNIRVNLVSPGRIDTTRDLSWYPRGEMTETSNIPLGRLGRGDDIAAACLFLVTDESGYMTGQTLHVNGGVSFF